MDAEPSDSSPDLGSVRRSGSGPLCNTGVVPMSAFVLFEFPSTSGHRRVRPSLAKRETVCVSASQAKFSSPAQGEEEWCPSPTRSPVLAISDVVLRADSPSVSVPFRQDLLSQLQDLASSAWDLEAVGMAHPRQPTLISSLPDYR